MNNFEKFLSVADAQVAEQERKIKAVRDFRVSEGSPRQSASTFPAPRLEGPSRIENQLKRDPSQVVSKSPSSSFPLVAPRAVQSKSRGSIPNTSLNKKLFGSSVTSKKPVKGKAMGLMKTADVIAVPRESKTAVGVPKTAVDQPKKVISEKAIQMQLERQMMLEKRRQAMNRVTQSQTNEKRKFDKFEEAVETASTSTRAAAPIVQRKLVKVPVESLKDNTQGKLGSNDKMSEKEKQPSKKSKVDPKLKVNEKSAEVVKSSLIYDQKKIEKSKNVIRTPIADSKLVVNDKASQVVKKSLDCKVLDPSNFLSNPQKPNTVIQRHALPVQNQSAKQKDAKSQMYQSENVEIVPKDKTVTKSTLRPKKPGREEIGNETFYQQNYSSIIKNMFGYDRSKFDDFADDDLSMESDYRTIQMEESRSAKIARLEDKIEEEKERQRLLTLKKKNS